jgi:hypothetical protein
MAGRGAPRTPHRLNDRLSPTLIEPGERILQSHDWDAQILLKSCSEKRDETPAGAKRTEGAIAAVISLLFEPFPGLTQPGEEEAEAGV